MLRTFFILAILVPGFYAALRSRYAALLLYVWFALFRPQDWIWIDITSLRLSLLLGVILLVPSFLKGLFPNLSHPLSIGMVAFIVSSVLSQFGAVDPDVGWLWIDFMVRLVLTCLMAVTLASTPQRIVGLIAIIGGSLGFHAAKAGFMYLLGGGTRFAEGLGGSFLDNNGYALGTVMVTPLLLATAQNVDAICREPFVKWARLAFYASVPLCMFAVVGTYSRGGFLAVAASAVAFVLLQRRRFSVSAGLAVAAGIILLVAPIPQTYLDRLQTIRTYEEIGEDSALSRPHFWRVGVQMALSKPLGVGLRQFESAYDAFDFTRGRFGTGRAVHNAHVQVFAELGFIGAAVWLGLFAYATYVCLRVRAQSFDERLSPDRRQFFFTIANGLLVSMVSFVVGGAFLSAALNDITWLTFALAAALDRVARAEAAPAPAAPARQAAATPLAFRVIGSLATSRGSRR